MAPCWDGGNTNCFTRQLPQTPKRIAQARLFAANFSASGRRALDQVSYDDPHKTLKAMQAACKRA